MLFTIVLLFVMGATQAQVVVTDGNEVADRIDLKVEELQALKVSPIVCYWVDSADYAQPYGSDCSPINIRYLVWNSGGKSFTQRFDECAEYKPEAFPAQFMSVVMANLDKIRKEKIKEPETTRIIKGEKKYLVASDERSNHTRFKFWVEDKSFEKDIDDFFLNTKTIDGKYLNSKYLENQRSTLNELKNMMEKWVKGQLAKI